MQLSLNNVSIPLFLVIGLINVVLYGLAFNKITTPLTERANVSLVSMATIGTMMFSSGVFSLVGCSVKKPVAAFVFYMVLGILSIISGVMAITELKDKEAKNYVIGMLTTSSVVVILSGVQIFMAMKNKQ